MKKVLSLVLVVAMMLSTMVLGVNAATYTEIDNTATKGYIQYPSDTTITNFVTGAASTANYALAVVEGSKIKYLISDPNKYEVEPGTSIYFIVCSKTDYNADKITKARLLPDDPESKTAVAKASSAVIKTSLRAYNAGIYWVGIEIPVKEFNVTTNTYEDPITVNVDVEVTQKSGDTSLGELITFIACYESNEGIADIGDAQVVVYYEAQDDVYISDEDGNFEIEAVATGKALAKVSMNNDTIDEIEDIYGQYASLEYYNGKGSLTRVKNTKVTIAADGCRYLYKYEDGCLVDLSSYYNSSADAFEMKISGTSYTLGTYVVSDVKLSSAKAATSTTGTTTSTGTAVKPVVPTTSGSTVKPVIPNTGVALELQ